MQSLLKRKKSPLFLPFMSCCNVVSASHSSLPLLSFLPSSPACVGGSSSSSSQMDTRAETWRRSAWIRDLIRFPSPSLKRVSCQLMPLSLPSSSLLLLFSSSLFLSHSLAPTLTPLCPQAADPSCNQLDSTKEKSGKERERMRGASIREPSIIHCKYMGVLVCTCLPSVRDRVWSPTTVWTTSDGGASSVSLFSSRAEKHKKKRKMHLKIHLFSVDRELV